MRRLSILLTVLLLLQTIFSGSLTSAFSADGELTGNEEFENIEITGENEGNMNLEEDLLIQAENGDEVDIEEVPQSSENEVETSLTSERDEEVEALGSTLENQDEVSQLEEKVENEWNHPEDFLQNTDSKYVMEISDIINPNTNEPYSDENPLGPNDEFWLKISWSLLDGHTYKQGDQEIIQLPEEIKITEEITDGELRDQFGNLVATYTVNTAGEVTITFTDYVENHSQVSGWIDLLAVLDQNQAEEADGKVVIGPIGEEGSLEVPLDTSKINKTLEKQGRANKSYNADEIEWTVTFNKNALSLTDVTLEDLLPEGTEYIDGSMEIIKYPASINGQPTGEESSVNISPNTENGKLTLDLGNINEVYVITYKTKVTDLEKKNFQNNVKVSFNDQETMHTHSTVTINRGEPLEKGVVKDYDPKTGIIEWYIKFNYNQKSLEDVTLEDHWEPKGKVELLEGTVKFQEVEIDENGQASPVGEPIDASEIGNLEKVEDGFKITGITTDKAYDIVYQTRVIERELDGFNLNNLASFENHQKGSGSYIGQHVGLKSAGEINYQDKTIEWTLRINMDQRFMKDVIITDTLGEGLTLIEDSIFMTIGGEAYDQFELENGNPFIISNIGDTSQEIVVTYKTSYDPNQLPEDFKAKNKADISWIPEESNERIKKDVHAEKPVNKETIDSSWKYGSYNPDTKEIEWTIIANYRENSYENLIILDRPQGNQKLLENSIKVFELSIDPQGKMKREKQVDIQPNISGNEFSITLGETDKAYEIIYKTSVAGLSDLNKEYINQAEVKNGDELLAEIDASVSVYGAKKYGNKSGVQEGKQIHWSINVNLAQELIANLELVDEITENQDYLEDTIKVYQASIDSNWKVIKGEELDPSEYELQVEDQSFTIKWKNNVERPFIVEYSTLFFAGHNETVNNKYTITGEGIEEVEGDSTDSANVTIRQTSSGGAVGTAGYLIIKKLDTTYDQEKSPLENVSFELIDPDTGLVLKVGETNAEGIIDFGRLLFGDYILREVEIPEGYVTLEQEQRITINQEYIPGEENLENYIFEVENYKPIYQIELLKYGKDRAKLAGAEFTLFNEADEVITSKTTDEDGSIIFDNLEPGKYYLQETKAPEGYELDLTKHPLEIDEKQKEPIKLEIENNPVKTSVDVKKIWKGSEESSVKIILLADQVEIDSIELNARNGWEHTFENLLAYSYGEEVKKIEYTVEEVEIEGYKSEVTGSLEEGFTVTNVRSGKTEVAVAKVWKGEAAESVTINLLANGEKVSTVDLSEENSWTHTFIDLDEFDEEGQKIEYTVEEVELEGYESEVTGSHEEGFVITNLRVGKTEVAVAKVWKGEAGDSVTINLLANGEKVSTVDLSEENSWTHTFTDLDEFDEEGQKIQYSVEEVELEGYKSEVTGSPEEGFTVTNVRSGKTEVSVAKVWKGEAADSVTINLLANGEKVSFVELSEENSWTHTFTDLDEFDEEGQKIEYTVEEVELEGYESEVTGSHEEGFVITNLRVGKTEVAVAKVWKGEAADSVTINLLANGEKVSFVELSEENSWTHTFTDLDEFDEEGQKIEYTVEEVKVDGYETEISGSHEEGFVITNLRTGLIDITIQKSWLDEDPADRPESIKINLLQNGIVIGEYDIKAENDWTLIISQLDQFDEEGQEYEYTITEHDLAGYEAKIDGFKITNIRTGEKSITVTKSWLDDDSQDRPKEIQVELYRFIKDGELEFVDIYTISAENQWELVIDGLPSFDEEGRAYSYEIKEVAVEGYESTINGFNITNLRVGEIDIPVEKVWKGEAGERVRINLLANDEVIDSVELTQANHWQHIFSGLALYDENGVAINYSIEEVVLAGYLSTISGSPEEGFVVINTRTGEFELNIEKIWQADEETHRPDSILVDLFRNGKLMTTLEIFAADQWKTSLILPKYDHNGEEYHYTIEERKVEGYTSEVMETEDGYIITNTFVPEESPVESDKPESGDQLPKTATNMFNYLLIGGLTTLLGAIVLVYARRREA